MTAFGLHTDRDKAVKRSLLRIHDTLTSDSRMSLFRDKVKKSGASPPPLMMQR